MIEKWPDTKMIEELLKYDTDLFLLLNNLGNETWDGMWLFITNKFSSIPLYLVLLYPVYKNLGLKGLLVIMVCTTLMITMTDQLSYFVKHTLKRPRPCGEEDLRSLMRFVADRCGRYGYFSGHAVSSMATAVFIGLTLKHKYHYLSFILLFWAFMIGFSRIYVGVHYPLDVLTGMIVGGLFGWLFYLIQKKAMTKLN